VSRAFLTVDSCREGVSRSEQGSGLGRSQVSDVSYSQKHCKSNIQYTCEQLEGVRVTRRGSQGCCRKAGGCNMYKVWHLSARDSVKLIIQL